MLGPGPGIGRSGRYKQNQGQGCHILLTVSLVMLCGTECKSLQLCLGRKRRQCFAYSTGVSTGTTNSYIDSVQFSSVAQSCVSLCDPMDCSIPGFPVHHQLLEFGQTHDHGVGDTIQSSHPHPFFCLQSFPASGSFPMNQFFTSGDQSIRVSASASALPMNIQD